MGTWDVHPFDNDEASDWAYELEESTDLSVLSRALQASPGYLEAPQGVEMVAAASVVAEALNPAQNLPENVAGWLSTHRALDFASLKASARAAVERVLGEQSELRELWAENQESFDDWKASLEKLLARL